MFWDIRVFVKLQVVYIPAFDLSDGALWTVVQIWKPVFIVSLSRCCCTSAYSLDIISIDLFMFGIAAQQIISWSSVDHSISQGWAVSETVVVIVSVIIIDIFIVVIVIIIVIIVIIIVDIVVINIISTTRFGKLRLMVITMIDYNDDDDSLEQKC